MITSRISSRCTKSSFHLFSSLRSYNLERFDLLSVDRDRINIDGYNDDGFLINNKQVYYSIGLLPNKSFLWNVPSFDYFTKESLAILELVPPVGYKNLNLLYFCIFLQSVFNQF